VQDVSGETTLPNAEAVGLGPTRRVILWSTILRRPFTLDEQRVVVAHELGHHDRNHLWKSVGWYALFALPGAFVIALVTRRRGGMRNPEAVPLGLLTFIVLSLIATPLLNVITRHMEAEADWVALTLTRDPQDAEGALQRVHVRRALDPSPPPGPTCSWRPTRPGCSESSSRGRGRRASRPLPDRYAPGHGTRRDRLSGEDALREARRAPSRTTKRPNSGDRDPRRARPRGVPTPRSSTSRWARSCRAERAGAGAPGGRWRGLRSKCPSDTINKVCASSIRAVQIADQMIRSGDHSVIVAGGMESMTNAPYVLKKARSATGSATGR
jgi:hypothetical protein